VNKQLILDQIITRAKQRSLDKSLHQIEVHHILPRSLGGTDEKENLVNLTAREHFIVHWLLALIHGGKMANAFWFMSQPSVVTKHKPNSIQYEIAKKLHSEAMSLAQRELIRRNVHSFNSKLSTKTNLKRVKNGTHPFAGEKGKNLQKELQRQGRHTRTGERGSKNSSRIQNNRVKNGTHPWAGDLGSKLALENCNKRIENGTHPWVGQKGSEFQKLNNQKRVQEGNHNWAGEKGTIRAKRYWANWRKNNNREPYPDDWMFV